MAAETVSTGFCNFTRAAAGTEGREGERMVREGIRYVGRPVWPEPEQSKTLTKAKLAAQVQQAVYGVKPWEAQRLVQRVLAIITDTLVRGEDVLISGFGKFMVRHKQARRGRNPQTGESLTLPARRVVVFRPATTLRQRLNPKAAAAARHRRR
ncbi:MAG: integration host factor subunit alpha [Desulfobacca sp.]|uniref:integration host factor subunit alpha n=1 Tax=Desulfobacca sp. TaxID=2067990 RepID=UPI0040495009